MADELLYTFDIDENTVWSSHDADGNLISQRLFKIDPSNISRFICYCDIPCYPTGLFLHLKIRGPKQKIFIHGSIGDFVWYDINANFIVNYYPCSGKIDIFDPYFGNIAAECLIESCWGSCVPKTYCSGEETLFGYHDFKLKQLEEDLVEKWYYCNDEEKVLWDLTGTWSKTGIKGTFSPMSATASVTIFLSQESVNMNIKNVTVTNIKPEYEYTGFSLYGNNAVILHFDSGYSNSSSTREFTFDAKVELETEGLSFPKGRLIFVDPNLWSFTLRSVSPDSQSTEDLNIFPLYKAKDLETWVKVDKEGKDVYEKTHQAIYHQNESNIPKGKYYFLSFVYQSYLDKNNHCLHNCYPANAPQASEDVDSYWPASSASTSNTAISKVKTYLSNTQSPVNRLLINRYGVQGSAIKALEAQKIEILKEGAEQNVLNIDFANTSQNPQVIYSNYQDTNQEEEIKGVSSMLDEFHFLCQDRVYRAPRHWEIHAAIRRATINSITTPQPNSFMSATPDELNNFNRHINIDISSQDSRSFSVRPNRSKAFDWKPIEWSYQYSVPVFINYWQIVTSDFRGRIHYRTFPFVYDDASNDFEHERKCTLTCTFCNDLALVCLANNKLVYSSPFGGNWTNDNYVQRKTLIIPFNPILYNLQNVYDSGSTIANMEEVQWDANRTSLGTTNGRAYTYHTTINDDNTNGFLYRMSLSSVLQGFIIMGVQEDYFSYFFAWSSLNQSGYRMNITQPSNSNTSPISQNILTNYAYPEESRSILTKTKVSEINFADLKPSTTFGSAAYNAIPLITTKLPDKGLDEWRVYDQNAFDKYSTYTYYFSDWSNWDWGGSYGVDAYFQIFNQEKYPDTLVTVFGWPTQEE